MKQEVNNIQMFESDADVPAKKKEQRAVIDKSYAQLDLSAWGVEKTVTFINGVAIAGLLNMTM